MNQLAQHLLQGPTPLTEAELNVMFRNRVLTLIHDFAEMGMDPDDIEKQLRTLIDHRSPTAYKNVKVPGPPPKEELKRRVRLYHSRR